MNKEDAFTIKGGKSIKGSTPEIPVFAINEGESPRETLTRLAERRRTVWEREKSIYLDKKICKENADIILDTPHIRQLIISSPYLLIECCFSLVGKDKNDKPFILNQVQRSFISKLELHGTKRPFFILKSRQQGFTTLITAIQLSYAITRRNFSGFTVADREDNVKSIFLDKAKLMYSRLPKRLKPTEKHNSSNELYFDKLNSSWRIGCASENLGRSRTLSFIHYSEAAFFKCSLASLQKSLQECLTENALCIYETTANGFGDAKELWDSSSCVNLFYKWWESDEYERDTAPEIKYDSFISERINHLRALGIPERKINWYVWKYSAYIDKSAIKQEYPCSPEEAFISSSESIFNKDEISDYLSKGTPSFKKGYFIYERENVPVISDGKVIHYTKRLTDIRFIESPEGYIRIVEEPYKKETDNTVEEKPYVIGADTSGTGCDFFAAKVIDNTNGRCVATLHKQKMDEDLFSEQLYCLGMYYCEALIAVETNFSRHPVRVLRSYGYTNIYASNGEEYCGFLTTSVTRPIMLANLVSIMRECIYLETDKDTLLEMLDFIKYPSGKAQASAGKHDDLVISSAIARYMGLSYETQIRVKKRNLNTLSRFFTLEIQEKNSYMEW